MLSWEVKNMTMCNCNCRCNVGCTVVALIVAAIIGVVTAFLQITGVITVAPVFLAVAFGIAVVYLGVLVATAGRRREVQDCVCTTLGAVLAGILGTALFSVILLLVGITATSIISALLVGLVAFFLALTLAASACYVRCVADCAD